MCTSDSCLYLSYKIFLFLNCFVCHQTHLVPLPPAPNFYIFNSCILVWFVCHLPLLLLSKFEMSHRSCPVPALWRGTTCLWRIGMIRSGVWAVLVAEGHSTGGGGSPVVSRGPALIFFYPAPRPPPSHRFPQGRALANAQYCWGGGGGRDFRPASSANLIGRRRVRPMGRQERLCPRPQPVRSTQGAWSGLEGLYSGGRLPPHPENGPKVVCLFDWFLFLFPPPDDSITLYLFPIAFHFVGQKNTYKNSRPGNTRALAPEERQRYKESADVENVKRRAVAAEAHTEAGIPGDRQILKHGHTD